MYVVVLWLGNQYLAWVGVVWYLWVCLGICGCVLQVEGVVGTYFANVRTPNASDGLTLVSYDKGGNWLPLTPPLDSQLTCQLVSAWVSVGLGGPR